MGRLNYDSAPALNVPTAATGDSSSAIASTAFVQAAIPAGVVLPFAGPQPPDGWFLCDGSAVSRTTYAKLYAAIGTTYGEGDGSTTFDLPDLRGEFVRGLDQGRGVDPDRALGTAQGHMVEAHTHLVGGSSQASGTPGGAVRSAGESNTNSSSYGGAETRPRNVAMNYIIKFA